MAENRLPNGVGKKIVQALKKQAEIEIQPISEPTLLTEKQTPNPEFYSAEIGDGINLENDFKNIQTEHVQNESIQDISANDLFNEDVELDSSFPANAINFEQTADEIFNQDDIFNTKEIPTAAPKLSQETTYSVPANVAVLKRLIMQLPQGVTKQTGAQIIRQTMEALGISMNSVLKEAQQGQDSLTASAKACLSTIQEYQNCIKGLEKQVQDYKKQAIALNDLINLFIMTDRH